MSRKSRLYNLEKLYEIDSTNEEFIREIISAFLKSIPMHARDLVVAANEKKCDEVYFLAHKMKANIDLLNIKTIKEEIRFVERNAKAKIHPDQIIEKAKIINITIQQCVKELREDFANNHHFDAETNCH